MIKANIKPIVPNSLKLAQVSIEKLNATYRFKIPKLAKKTAQAKLSLFQMDSGSLISLPIIILIMFFSVKKRAPIKTDANVQ